MSAAKDAYRLTKPCSNCPFRTDVKPYLRADRVEDIRTGLVRGEFMCHKTTRTVEDEDGNERRIAVKTSAHCAGALILLEKLDEPSQMMRIMERIGCYDRRKLDMDAPVYDTWEEMVDAQAE